MSLDGTSAHLTETDLPPLVALAVAAARTAGFANSCRPEQGRLLHALAGGARARIGESGTGLGVGLAWLAAGARAGVRLISVERDAARPVGARRLFAGHPAVQVLHADWTELYRHAPYDLLVLDSGGQAKGGSPAHPSGGPEDTADPVRLLTPGGVLVIDDFTPSASWPPLHRGRPDHARLHWLRHPALRTVELPLAADLSTLLAVRTAAGADSPD
ncbi:O-methyltransferase [Kitasatospora sp. HPMI-4]|uniref:O-methyltransferase n=1 Tax=Kitasatospora sp. HPMI-4 TaxID=3448443 RepID=UPI003F1DD685